MSWRVRCAARTTNAKRFSSRSKQSSTVTRAMVGAFYSASTQPATARPLLDADIQAVSEVALELGFQDLLGCALDVVLDALEVEALLVGIVDRVARAVVVVAGLADRADAHDVATIRVELE